MRRNWYVQFCPSLLERYDKYYGSLDFHHKNPEEKEFSLSHSNLNLKLMLKEASKCVVLCANCHRELHAGIITLDKEEQIV